MASPFRQDLRGLYASNPALAALKNVPMAGQPMFRLDEGYSEETRSQSGASEVAFRADSSMDQEMEQILPDWLMAMSEEQRSEFAYIVLRSLRTSSIAGIVDKLNPLLHIDPVLRLPTEIMFEILACLDPTTLLRVSTLSKMWQTRALESRLWRMLFAWEGWNPDLARVRAFETSERQRIHGSKARKIRGRPSDADIDRHVSKKRAKEPSRLSAPSVFEQLDMDESPADWAEQAEIVEADETSPLNSEDRMQDVSYQQPPLPAAPPMLQPDEDMLSPPLPQTSDRIRPSARPALLIEESGADPRINWQYLYKQKRRLEENWNAGRYKNFQLPHPAHPEEAHDECVYTIQYSSAHLVSGSRDKSIRIWNLETQRLLRTLKGHNQSVLCLQFDERPEHDLIASGGSDTHVLLWRFSTGELIRRLDRAHTESVLNLRFDERFLITCSKDKTIKVWNRQSLTPGDVDYPDRTGPTAKYPSHIVNVEQLIANQGLHGGLKSLEPFMLLMTLHGHTAAVNAIQVLDGQVVSASGDRTVKVWDIKSGICLKTITGHLKGIACVQFDGRRVVSGSSDDSVRIFDRATGAEVACLRGHSNLVRTVQARFGDLPGNEDELEAEAKAVDRRYFEARADGDATPQVSREQRYARNSGSSDPKDIWAWGAKIPPGGGGSRWARIVSGSYDETVIIWKRNSEGRWTSAHKLHQWEAVINAGGRPRHLQGAGQQQHQQQQQQQANAPQNQGAGQNQGAQAAAGGTALAQVLVDQAQAQIEQATTTIAQAQQVVQQHHSNASSSSTAAQQGSAASTAGPASAPSASASTAATQQQQHTATASRATRHGPPPLTHFTTTRTTTTQSHRAGAQQQQLPLHPGSSQPGPSQGPANPNAQASSSSQPSSSATQTQVSTQTPTPQPQQQHPQQQQQASTTTTTTSTAPVQHVHHHHHHHHHPVFGQGGTNSRVFKLQFDSRRIVCCSQDPTIVGWDFADGDEDIVSASRFFGEEM